MLYAVNELDDGAVSAFAVAPDGTLTPSGTWPSGGSYPCHLTLDLTGRHLLIANYGSGTVTALALGPDGVPTGRSHSVAHSVAHSGAHSVADSVADSVAHSGRGEHPERQEGPHAHAVAAVADGSAGGRPRRGHRVPLSA